MLQIFLPSMSSAEQAELQQELENFWARWADEAGLDVLDQILWVETVANFQEITVGNYPHPWLAIRNRKLEQKLNTLAKACPELYDAYAFFTKLDNLLYHLAEGRSGEAVWKNHILARMVEAWAS